MINVEEMILNIVFLVVLQRTTLSIYSQNVLYEIHNILLLIDIITLGKEYSYWCLMAERQNRITSFISMYEFEYF